MKGWIHVGSPRDGELPGDRLSAEEMAEVERLLAARSRLEEQSRIVDQQLKLLLLSAKDRRGIEGAVGVDPLTGKIMAAEGDGDG